jgi:hypothetical protein
MALPVISTVQWAGEKFQTADRLDAALHDADERRLR